MKRTTVISSNLQSVGYDVQTKTLEVQFNNGSVYQYYQVPHEVYLGLMTAESHGKYFHAVIRNVYQYKEMGYEQIQPYASNGSENKSNFKDLAVISAFSKSKPYIYSLIEEINRDVFDNSGWIETNVGSDFDDEDEDESTWEMKKKIPSSENIILYIGSNFRRDRAYIGILELNGVDIRIIAQNDYYKNWIIKTDKIIEGLRTAIQWWKTEGRYTERDEESIREQEESEAFWDEMHDLGLSEDDFGGRD